MSFRRTNAGLSNLHRFHGVDVIVFVEGGAGSYTLEQVRGGAYNALAHDLKYWRIVFNTFGTGKVYHLRAVGSKTTIIEIASLVFSRQITHGFAAMDRDFDHLTGSLPTGAGIFSTSGYSWENDVWTNSVVFDTFQKFNTSPEAGPQAKEIIEKEFSSVDRQLKPCVRADAVLCVNKLEPLQRRNFEKIIRPAPAQNGVPYVDRSAAKSLIRQHRLKIRPEKAFARGVKLSTLADCCGHVLENFGYNLLVHLLKKFCKFRTTPKELLVPAAIDAFGTQLRTNVALANHYVSLFTAANAVL